MRGVRGDYGEPVSLFAFQDIMTAVIGILLLIVLLMCLQLSVTTASASSVDEKTSTADRLESDLREVTDQEATTDVAIAQALEELKLQTRTLPKIDRVVVRRRELSELYERIAQAEASVRGVFEGLLALTEGGVVQAQLEEAIELEQKKERLQSELDAVRRHRGLTYLQNQRFEKSPLLVVLSGDVIRVGEVGLDQAALTFAHRDVDTRMQAVVQWLQRFSAQRYYVLVVIKPSTRTYANTLRTMITQNGFSQGMDLLPEDWRVLYYSPLVEELPR